LFQKWGHHRPLPQIEELAQDPDESHHSDTGVRQKFTKLYLEFKMLEAPTDRAMEKNLQQSESVTLFRIEK